MESQNVLGIYFTRDTATVVCLNLQGKGDKIPVCFTVTARDQEQPQIQALAGLIAQGCSERKLSFAEVAVAIDCSLFMQHSVHSEFADRKQISATVRFDTEEILATDISETALTFEINSKGESGADLTVFTAQKKILSEILLSLQQYDFDPITILPDVVCLSKLIFYKMPKGESLQGSLFGMLSENNGYLVAARDPDGSGSYNASIVRTFLVGPRQNRTDLLAREIMMSTALFSGEDTINSLRIFDSAGIADFPSLTDKTGILARKIELFGDPAASDDVQENQVNRIDFAIAYGAALSLTEKEQTINFRDDFSPFQGKKIKTQKALKFAMVSLTMLLIAVGLYFTMNLFSVNRDIKKARAKFSKNYEIVMGKTLSSATPTRTALKKIGYEFDEAEKRSKGIITGASISSKLTLVLTAFKKCAKQIDLKIDSIDLTEKNITIIGDISNRSNTTEFLDVLKDTGLKVKSSNIIPDQKTRRDNFQITLEPMT